MQNKPSSSNHSHGQLLRSGASSFVLLVAFLLPSIISSSAMASGRHSSPPQCVPTAASSVAPAQAFSTQLVSYSPPTPTQLVSYAPSVSTAGNSSAGGNSGNGTVPSHSNGNGGGDGGLGSIFGGGGGSVFGGGGGGNSGGAPSPEVDAILGLALAGSTVAFLRRRRRERVVMSTCQV